MEEPPCFSLQFEVAKRNPKLGRALTEVAEKRPNPNRAAVVVLCLCGLSNHKSGSSLRAKSCAVERAPR